MRITSMKDKNKLIETIRSVDGEQCRQLVIHYLTEPIIHCENIVKGWVQAKGIAQGAFIKAD